MSPDHDPPGHDSSGRSARVELSAGLLIAGRCRLEEYVAEGGQGVVWRARDEGNKNGVCALKFLLPKFVADEVAVADLIDEIAHCKKVDHAHIVRIDGLLKDRALRRIAVQMEFVAGGSISARCVQRPHRRFEPWEIADWMQQLCSALEHAHQAKIVHRDLKPGNLLLDAEDRVKLADFGLARAVLQSVVRKSMAQPMAGTPHFASPEQLRGYPEHPSDDLYALGATIYALLTGKPPYFREGWMGIIDRQRDPNDIPPSIARRREEFGQPGESIPPEWEEVVAALLAKEAKNRPASAAEVAARLFAPVVPPAGQAATDVVAAVVTETWSEPSTLPAARPQECTTKPVETISPLAPPPQFSREREDDESLSPPAEVVPKQTERKIDGPPEEATKFGESGELRNSLNPDQRHIRRSRIHQSAVFLFGLGLASLVAFVFLIPWLREHSATGRSISPHAATKVTPFVNSLGMKFVPVAGTDVLFSIWDTRVQDYAVYAREKGVAPVGPQFEQSQTHPVAHVSWEDANAFCSWLSQKEGRTYRLPTDAEWSVAVGLGPEQGTTPEEKEKNSPGNVYPWGTQWPPPKGAGNFADETAKKERLGFTYIDGYDDGYTHTSPVGSFTANRYGLYDMGGNVEQWCADWFDTNRNHRVLRGGSYYSTAGNLRSSCRIGAPPTVQGDINGFRCVLVVSDG